MSLKLKKTVKKNIDVNFLTVIDKQLKSRYVGDDLATLQSWEGGGTLT